MKLFLCLSASCLAIASTQAVIVRVGDGPGDGSGNTTAPSSVWNNVGYRGSATAVYLGNKWVITANHVGPGNVILGGNTFLYDTGTAQIVPNPTGMGLTTNTDLVLFRLQTDPGLPAIALATSSPALADPVLMIGAGRDRQTTQTEWLHTVNPGPSNDVWAEQTGGGTLGYKWLGSATMRWGENNVAQISPPFPSANINTGFGDVRSFMTTFDNAGVNEAQGASGDSGGAVFSGTTLVGIMHAIAGFENQPASTAIFGNVTLSADIAFYNSQIQAIMIPEPSAMALGLVGMALFHRRRRPALLS